MPKYGEDTAEFGRKGESGPMAVHVLLVEDEDSDAELAKRQFRQMGPEFALDRVSSLEGALHSLATGGYQLVLLDLGLPGTYGLSALKSVCAAHPDLPIIVLTGHDDQTFALTALREGAQDYLVKGKSTTDTVIRAVRYALERGRLQAERAALERKLAHTQRLEALGRFAGGIAHEINNRLTPIIGMAEFQRAALPEGDRVRGMADIILTAAEDAAHLVRNLLTFAHHQATGEKGAVDLGATIDQATTLIRPTMPATLRLDVAAATGLPTVHGNATQLLSLALNLLSNAVDAMDGRAGTVSVTLDVVNSREVEFPTSPPLVHPRYLRLAIRDEGIGMDDETVSRAFDPFFTRKAVDKGCGLGLSVVRGIVLDHQGAIAVASTPGHGTDVQVFLPVDE